MVHVNLPGFIIILEPPCGSGDLFHKKAQAVERRLGKATLPPYLGRDRKIHGNFVAGGLGGHSWGARVVIRESSICSS